MNNDWLLARLAEIDALDAKGRALYDKDPGWPQMPPVTDKPKEG